MNPSKTEPVVEGEVIKILSMKENLTCDLWLKDEGNHMARNEGSSLKMRDDPRPDNSQQGALSSTTDRNWVLPTSWISLAIDSSPGVPDERPAWLAPWFWPSETLRREPNWARPDFWPTGLWGHSYFKLPNLQEYVTQQQKINTEIIHLMETWYLFREKQDGERRRKKKTTTTSPGMWSRRNEKWHSLFSVFLLY